MPHIPSPCAKCTFTNDNLEHTGTQPFLTGITEVHFYILMHSVTLALRMCNKYLCPHTHLSQKQTKPKALSGKRQETAQTRHRKVKERKQHSRLYHLLLT